MYMDLDYEKLRNDLLDYYGTFMVNLFPAAIFELGRIEKASEQELLTIAQENNFDLNDYKKRGKFL